MPALRELEDLVLAYIGDPTIAEFADVAARIVEYQRTWNQKLRAFWDRRRFDGSGRIVHEIPAVPTDVFRHVRLHSSEEPVQTTFRTSGTTSGARGESHRLSTRAYDAGAVRHSREMVLSSGPYRFVNLVFDPERHRDSSLSHMVKLLAAEFGDGSSAYYLNEGGVDVAGLEADLARPSGPVALFGTAFALVAALDGGLSQTSLPPGSVVVETGGFKGKSRTIARDELYRALSERLGVPAGAIRSEYSMTELSSQLYSRSWDLTGDQPLVPPHWCQVSAVDPETLAPLRAGEVGLLRFVDLANIDTVVAIQTSDLGVVQPDGAVVLRGRALGAQPRGCSLAVEEILDLTQESFT